MDPLFQIPEEIAALGADVLRPFIESASAQLAAIGSDPRTYLTEGRSFEDFRAEVAEAVEAVREAREALAALEADPETLEVEEPEAEVEPEPEAEASEEELAAIVALAAEAEEPEVVEPEAVETVTASATKQTRRPRPARSRHAVPTETEPERVALTAGAGAGLPAGAEFPDELAIARAMVDRRRQFGLVAEGDADNVPIARASWGHLYEDERTIFGKDGETQEALVAAVIDPKVIRANFEKRVKDDPGSLVASGGLCAPVTPYYNLMMISQAERPVRAALPAFNADRGGLKYATPASLASITTGVAALTATQDHDGSTKACQSVDCPSFTEADVEILYHCLKFGNLGARTFPERVAQWNNLVLAAHARLGDRTLLSGIDSASTAVTANTLGLGASADLLSQILVAGAAMRSRHRMDPQAILRVLLPKWIQELIVSDVYRSQFQRFDMTPERFVALLRAGNVEPTFYIDSAAGKNQEFGVQNAGALLNFPQTVTWYLFAEGSFLYLDGGILELGLVRDSVLNSTNDFEIFGESFENVAYIGVESLAITSTLCDSGVTAGTHNPTCPILYSDNS